LPLGVDVVRDEVEGLGPLAGLAAGLAALEGRADAAYLSACDVPLLSTAFVRRIAELLGTQSACVPEVDGYRHPLAAVYRLSIRPVVMEWLSTGRLRMTDLFDAVPSRIVGPLAFANIDPRLDSLRNVNTPEEHAAVLQSSLPTEP
jgi:molybdopterin-guanine dinucleotide biosynthesis protein A